MASVPNRRGVVETDGPTQAAPARFSLPRMRRHWSLLVTLVVVAAAMLGAIFLIFQTIEAERAQRAQVVRTNAILAQLRAKSVVAKAERVNG